MTSPSICPIQTPYFTFHNWVCITSVTLIDLYPFCLVRARGASPDKLFQRVLHASLIHSCSNHTEENWGVEITIASHPLSVGGSGRRSLLWYQSYSWGCLQISEWLTTGIDFIPALLKWLENDDLKKMIWKKNISNRMCCIIFT